MGSGAADLSSQRTHIEQLVEFCFELVCTKLLSAAVSPSGLSPKQHNIIYFYRKFFIIRDHKWLLGESQS